MHIQHSTVNYRQKRWEFLNVLFAKPIMGCQVCQKYLQMLYLYISLWYINMTQI